MRFDIKGVDRKTGEDATVTVDAPTPSAAEERANAMGLMVEAVDVSPNARTIDGPPLILRLSRKYVLVGTIVIAFVGVCATALYLGTLPPKLSPLTKEGLHERLEHLGYTYIESETFELLGAKLYSFEKPVSERLAFSASTTWLLNGDFVDFCVWAEAEWVDEAQIRAEALAPLDGLPNEVARILSPYVHGDTESELRAAWQFIKFEGDIIEDVGVPRIERRLIVGPYEVEVVAYATKSLTEELPLRALVTVSLQ